VQKGLAIKMDPKMNAEKVLKLAYSMSLDYRECSFDLQMAKIIVI